MDDWQLFTSPALDLRFRYPRTTPQGRPVEIHEGQRDLIRRVHLVSRDSPEVYFEVIRFPDLSARAEYARHKVFLAQQFAAAGFAISGLQESSLGELAVQEYSFRWDRGARVVVLIERAPDTVRVIYDPRSALNREILSTLALPDW